MFCNFTYISKKKKKIKSHKIRSIISLLPVSRITNFIFTYVRDYSRFVILSIFQRRERKLNLAKFGQSFLYCPIVIRLVEFYIMLLACFVILSISRKEEEEN